MDVHGDEVCGEDQCEAFDQELWFGLRKIMWINHSSIYQYHSKYIHNDFNKPCIVSVLHYANQIHETQDMDK